MLYEQINVPGEKFTMNLRLYNVITLFFRVTTEELGISSSSIATATEINYEIFGGSKSDSEPNVVLLV